MATIDLTANTPKPVQTF